MGEWLPLVDILEPTSANMLHFKVNYVASYLNENVLSYTPHNKLRRTTNMLRCIEMV